MARLMLSILYCRSGVLTNLAYKATSLIVLWNTIYTAEVLEYLQLDRVEVNPDDVARLSPLKYKHINMLGRYQFSLPDSVQQGKMRRLNLGYGKNYL
jgi:hypothetical protein